MVDPRCDETQIQCDQVLVRVWVEYPADTQLQIGETAFSIPAGTGTAVAGIQTAVREPIRLVTARCVTAASFTASPGTNWSIRMVGSGRVSIEDVTGQAFELGPGLNESDRLC